MAKLEDDIKAIEDRVKELEESLKAVTAQADKASKRLESVPTPRQLGYNIPVHEVETDKYLKFQLELGKLTLLLNTDQVKRDMVIVPGGGGSPYPNCTDFSLEAINLPGEGTEGVEVNTWEPDDVAPAGAVLYLVTRVFYDDSASDPTLKAYQRPLTFDPTGKLCSIGAEEEYTIDDPEACP